MEFELEQIDPYSFKLTGTLPGRMADHAPVQFSVSTETDFTPRELDVLSWTLEGKLTPEIGIILGIRPETVEKHLKSICEKLGVHKRAEIIRITTSH